MRISLPADVLRMTIVNCVEDCDCEALLDALQSSNDEPQSGLQSGWDDDEGRTFTALELAVKNLEHRIVIMLLLHGADPQNNQHDGQYDVDPDDPRFDMVTDGFGAGVRKPGFTGLIALVRAAAPRSSSIWTSYLSEEEAAGKAAEERMRNESAEQMRGVLCVMEEVWEKVEEVDVNKLINGLRQMAGRGNPEPAVRHKLFILKKVSDAAGAPLAAAVLRLELLMQILLQETRPWIENIGNLRDSCFRGQKEVFEMGREDAGAGLG